MKRFILALQACRSCQLHLSRSSYRYSTKRNFQFVFARWISLCRERRVGQRIPTEEARAISPRWFAFQGLSGFWTGRPWSAVLRCALLMRTNRAGKATSTLAPPNLIAPYNAPGAATTKLYSTLLEIARLPNCSERWKEPDRTKDGDQSASEWNTAKVSCPTFFLWPLSSASSLFKIRRTSVSMM